ncbi:MAG: ABC transporter ATP-binding protein [Gammaproteobacteria bacterium]|nr:ABC transporter ATP-binding protein [Gammaproteobacteria bacterium]
MAAIRASSLHHRYQPGAPSVLEGVDLELRDGEAHAVLGGSGAGKTTLLHLLAGLLRPSAGTIEFDGRDLTAASPAERQVAQVFQFPVLYPALDVAGNLGFPLVNRGWNAAAVRRRVGEVAELLSIAALLTRKPKQLSLFERQLTAIGRALVRPDVALVLLDEPLTAVEPAAKWRLRQALKTVQGELGLTMIYVTHDQTEALTFAERITLLHHGKALQTGSPEALYEQPAHEAVARFIGSPGMNLVDGEVSAGSIRCNGQVLGATAAADGRCALGFRPEWAAVGERGVPVAVRSARALGTLGGVATGLVTAELGGQAIHVQQRLDGPVGSQARLHIDPSRILLYRNGWLVTDATG